MIWLIIIYLGANVFLAGVCHGLNRDNENEYFAIQLGRALVMVTIGLPIYIYLIIDDLIKIHKAHERKH